MCISSNPAAGWWCCGMACRPIAADLCWTGSQANARGCPSNACLATRRSSIRPSKSLATSNPASSPTCVAIPSLRSRQAPKTAWIASAATHDSASRSFVTPASAYDQTPPAITRTSLEQVQRFSPATFRGVFERLRQVVLDFAIHRYTYVQYGAEITDVWQEYRALV